jgi:capsid protein
MLVDEFKEIQKKHEEKEKAARQQQQQFSAHNNSYTTTRGTYGRTFDGSKYPGGITDSGTAKIADGHRLRMNARNAAYDSVQAATVLRRIVATQVNKGLILESIPRAEILGITQEEAEQIGSQLTQRFAQWAGSLQSTLSETHTFYQLQRTLATYQHRDNDAFLYCGYSGRRDLISPLQVKLIDPEQLIGRNYTFFDGLQNHTSDGIERDKNGRELAYWLQVVGTDGSYRQKRIPKYGARSGRIQMCHLYIEDFADSGRGSSPFAHALQNFTKLSDLELAHIIKAVNQSNITMTVKPSENADASDPMEGFTSDVSGPSPGVSPAAAQLTDEDDTIVDVISLPEASIEVPGSTAIFNLRRGEELVPFDGKAPSDSYANFVDAFMSYLSASMNVPLEVLTMKFGENYSASRATLLLFWDIVLMWIGDMVAQVLHPVYSAWVAEEIAAGRVTLRGFSDPRMRAAWLNSRWNGTPMPNIDPMKSAQADKLYLEMGATHLDAVAMEFNGSDGRANRTKLARQLEELPQVPWGDGAAQAQQGSEDSENSGQQAEEDTDGES